MFLLVLAAVAGALYLLDARRAERCYRATVERRLKTLLTP